MAGLTSGLHHLWNNCALIEIVYMLDKYMNLKWLKKAKQSAGNLQLLTSYFLSYWKLYFILYYIVLDDVLKQIII